MSNWLHFVIRSSAFALPPALQAALNKKSDENRKSREQIDAAIRQLVSKAITTEGEIIDVFIAAGLTPSRPRSVGLGPALYAVCLGRPAWLPRLKKPDIGILSPQFLAEVCGLKHKNVAAELLEKLLKDELKVEWPP